MKPSPVLKAVLFVFVAAAAGAMAYKAAVAPASDPSQEPAAVPAGEKNPEAPAKKALVYYFYTGTRCHSCTTLEKYTREAVEGNFGEPYKGWRVEFRGVNLDEPANGHFVGDYKLTSKAVVAQKFEGDEPLAWKEMPEVWRMLGNQELFTGYVVGEIQGLLDAK
ncbi:MAG: nitrophenyl compound nitroreductase subunit ArsF family protein [Elusimicrobiales bacterium]|nr:nitrophenyl compound nitroreductase subunit ArsF family protein [Elusimicrobiales bacterium]